MKKCLFLLLLPLLLTGCGDQETYETVSDEILQPVAAIAQQTVVQLPDGAAVSVMQNDEEGTLYFCQGYTMTMQTMEAGDLNRTVKAVTGYGKDDLQLIRSGSHDAVRYDCVWAAAGEGEDQVGRAAILDDGNYHYVLTCMTGASQAEALQEHWQALFESFSLASTDLRTGS